MTDVRPIGELVSKVIDYRGKTPPKTDEGVPLITAKVIKGGRIERVQEYISEDTYGSWMRRGLPVRGDVLVTTEAPLGEVAQVPQDDRIALAQRVILLRPDPAKIDPQYFFHFLRSPQALARLQQRASGTTVAGIRQPELKAVLVDLLDRRAQEAVGQVLDALDALIENNQRRVEVLQGMAGAIFQEWFVRYKYPGHEGVPVIDSPLGLLPEGWTVRPMNASGPFGLHKQRIEPYSGTRRYLATADCSGFHNIGEGSDLEYSCLPSRAQLQPAADTVFFGRMAGYQKVIGMPGGSPEIDQYVLSSGFACVRCDPGWFAFVLSSVLAEEFESTKARFATGATQVSLTDTGALGMPWLVPSPAVALRYEEVARPIYVEALNLLRSNRVISALRDVLLPRLVSGQVDVLKLDLDALTEEATA